MVGRGLDFFDTGGTSCIEFRRNGSYKGTIFGI
jgi:hypothetical protein